MELLSQIGASIPHVGAAGLISYIWIRSEFNLHAWKFCINQTSMSTHSWTTKRQKNLRNINVLKSNFLSHVESRANMVPKEWRTERLAVSTSHTISHVQTHGDDQWINPLSNTDTSSATWIDLTCSWVIEYCDNPSSTHHQKLDVSVANLSSYSRIGKKLYCDWRIPINWTPV